MVGFSRLQCFLAGSVKVLVIQILVRAAITSVLGAEMFYVALVLADTSLTIATDPTLLFDKGLVKSTLFITMKFTISHSQRDIFSLPIVKGVWLFTFGDLLHLPNTS
jgi:hypothetical protein